MADKKFPEHFCPIPFLQLQLNPQGNVSACCFSGEHKIGNVKEDTIENIWNNAEIQKWRQEFLDDNIQICKEPIKNFECHKMFQHLIEHVDPVAVQKKMPRRLDLRLNGKCNLSCIMCDVWMQPNGLYDKSDFWQIGPEKIFPFLLEIDMLGGEPFIQKDTFRFIDEVSRVNKNCTWGFITNGAYVYNDYIEKHLDKLKIRSIHLSLDSCVPETYEKIRKNGDYKRTYATVRKFIEYRHKREARNEGFTLFASMCVQKDNWSEIAQFLNFCREHGLQPILQSLIERPHLSLAALDRTQLRSILTMIEPFLHTYERFTVLPLHQDVTRIMARLDNEKN